MTPKVTLQISLAPSDYRHCRFLLRHQLDTWAGQVEEVLLTYDTHRSKGRFAHNWEENHRLMTLFLEEIVKKFPSVRLVQIDYSDKTRRVVGQKFFSTPFIPPKDFRGGPFYTYFYGLYTSTHPYVFHLDSDMFFGGGSQTWVSEAVKLMEDNQQVLFCSPLPGPPKSGGELVGQPGAVKFAHGSTAFAFSNMSTRLFMVNKQRLERHKMPLLQPPFRSVLKAWVEGNPAYDLPENIMSHLMQSQRMLRVDFLGSRPGMWSIHPPYRTENFYNSLPELLQRIVNNDVPADQLGFYDMTDTMCDWAEARNKLKENRWWRRL